MAVAQGWAPGSPPACSANPTSTSPAVRRRHHGTSGHHGERDLLGYCDTLLIVGSNDPWTEFYPPPGMARAVQIDIDGRKVGNRYPVEVPLVGDAAGTLTRTVAGCSGTTPVRGGRRSNRASGAGTSLRITGPHAGRPVNPERVVSS